MKKFFDALKTVYGPQSLATTSLLSADGTSLLTDKEAMLKRWAEHFDGVLNRPSSINDEAINRLPQVECNPLLDELPTVSETVKAIQLLSSGKAPGYTIVRFPEIHFTASRFFLNVFYRLCVFVFVSFVFANLHIMKSRGKKNKKKKKKKHTHQKT